MTSLPHTNFEQNLVNIIRPLRTAKWSADYSWVSLERGLSGLGNDYGSLELNPDFQRGHVWTASQQAHFIENCLRGVVAANGYLLQFNCAAFSDDMPGVGMPEGLECLDGLQRYTAVTEFIKGNVKPFGLTACELEKTQFSPKRLFMKVAIHDFTYREDLLEHYLSINTGGTPHSEEEIEKVRALLACAKSKSKSRAIAP